jgi:hypothetical protein
MLKASQSKLEGARLSITPHPVAPAQAGAYHASQAKEKHGKHAHIRATARRASKFHKENA